MDTHLFLFGQRILQLVLPNLQLLLELPSLLLSNTFLDFTVNSLNAIKMIVFFLSNGEKGGTKRHVSVPESGVSLSPLGFGFPFLHIWSEQPGHVHSPV